MSDATQTPGAAPAGRGDPAQRWDQLLEDVASLAGELAEEAPSPQASARWGKNRQRLAGILSMSDPAVVATAYIRGNGDDPGAEPVGELLPPELEGMRSPGMLPPPPPAQAERGILPVAPPQAAPEPPPRSVHPGAWEQWNAASAQLVAEMLPGPPAPAPFRGTPAEHPAAADATGPPPPPITPPPSFDDVAAVAPPSIVPPPGVSGPLSAVEQRQPLPGALDPVPAAGVRTPASTTPTPVPSTPVSDPVVVAPVAPGAFGRRPELSEDPIAPRAPTQPPRSEEPDVVIPAAPSPGRFTPMKPGTVLELPDRIEPASPWQSNPGYVPAAQQKVATEMPTIGIPVAPGFAEALGSRGYRPGGARLHTRVRILWERLITRQQAERLIALTLVVGMIVGAGVILFLVVVARVIFR